jgi:hypothetical protein
VWPDLKHHHGGISVPDLEASIASCAKVLDFEVENASRSCHGPEAERGVDLKRLDDVIQHLIARMDRTTDVTGSA